MLFRSALDEPRNVTSGEKLIGKFRSGDVRWALKPREIKNVSIRPGFPPTYLLDGPVGEHKITPVGYTKNQLQVIPEKEIAPQKKVIRGTPSTYVVEEIMERKKEKGRIFYLVRWKGYDESDDTWEPRTTLMEDVPDLVKDYENQWVL